MTRHRTHHRDEQKLYYEKLADEVISRSAKILDAKEEEWEWGDYVAVHDGGIRVSLAGLGVRDADLESLCSYLLWSWEETYFETFPSGCDLTMDLSCNVGISDYGIKVHLVPFLKKWPSCRRLKLFQTSIGDRALEALLPWVAKGFAHEIHMSDLNGEVSSSVVLKLLKAIHNTGRYPYWKANGSKAPLWLRLEHNRLPNPEELVAQARSAGVSIRILGRSELSSVRPGDDLRKRGQDNPEVILVLFKLQQRKELAQDECVEQTRDLLNMLGKTAGAGGSNDAAEEEPQRYHSSGFHRRGGRGGGGRGRGSTTGLPASDPQPLSVDEFRLWEMQAREDEECGADERNWETFGADVGKGWTFEENLKANAGLARRAARAAREWSRWQQQGWGSQMLMTMPTPAQMAYTAEQAGHHGAAGQRWGPCAEGRQWAEDVSGGGYSSSIEYGCSASASATTATTTGCKVQIAKTEIEEAITHAIQIIPTLQRPDFDGQVKQYLHAIRNKGGSGRVMEAIQALRIATAGKQRNSIRRWPAYLVALLKRFLGELQSGGAAATRGVRVLSTGGSMYVSGPSSSCASRIACGDASEERARTTSDTGADGCADTGDSGVATSADTGAADENDEPLSFEVADSAEDVADMDQLPEESAGVAFGTEAGTRAISAELTGLHGRLQ